MGGFGALDDAINLAMFDMGRGSVQPAMGEAWETSAASSGGRDKRNTDLCANNLAADSMSLAATDCNQALAFSSTPKPLCGLGVDQDFTIFTRDYAW